MNKKGQLIVVSGFAGTGKGTITRALLERYDEYVLSVSATTRNPRPGEEEGVHYFFKTREEFEEMIRRDELLEHACYVENYYGTPKAYVEAMREAGKDVILEIEIQGGLSIKEKYPDAILLFVTPPSAEELKRRLVGRGTETPEVVEKRMARAFEESDVIEKYDYLIINDDLEECIKQTHEIIRAAHYSTLRNPDFIKEVRRQLKDFAG